MPVAGVDTNTDADGDQAEVPATTPPKQHYEAIGQSRGGLTWPAHATSALARNEDAVQANERRVKSWRPRHSDHYQSAPRC